MRLILRQRRNVAAVMITGALLLTGCAGSLRPASQDSSGAAAPPDIIELWQGPPPNAKALAASESQVVKDLGWRSIIEVHNVSTPSLTVVQPKAKEGTGPAMLVLPGGAFGILAWDVEGTEVAEFLADRGITTFILKYRVSDPTPEEVQAFIAQMSDPEKAADPTFLIKQLASKREPAVEDALQAMRVVRANASEYGIDPDRVGMMGFSAGAITTFAVLQRADDAARPNIAAPIYGLAFEPEVPPIAPPLFMAVAKDDPIMAGASTDIQKAWQAAGKTSELHIFESGEHGFGIGRPGTDSMRFGGLLEGWLRAQGFVR